MGDSIDSAAREIKRRTKKEPRFDIRGHAISDNASIVQSNLSRAQYGECSCRCGELRRNKMHRILSEDGSYDNRSHQSRNVH